MHTEEGAVRNPAETEPLLVPQRPDRKQRVGDTTAFWKLCAASFFVNLGIQLLGPAQTQIFENIYCAQWYERHPTPGLPLHGHIPESYCKIGPVQTQVSWLKGWLEVAVAAPGLVLSIPIGMLADAVGRRHLLILNVLTVFLAEAWITFVSWLDGQMSLRAVWLAGIFGCLSGGMIVTEMLFVVRTLSPISQLLGLI